jgi:hypothetical protein
MSMPEDDPISAAIRKDYEYFKQVNELGNSMVEILAKNIQLTNDNIKTLEQQTKLILELKRLRDAPVRTRTRRWTISNVKKYIKSKLR